MTKREADEYFVELKPKPVFNPSIRRRPSLEDEKAQPEGRQETSPASASLPSPTPSAEESPSQRPPNSSPNLLEPARTDIFNFRFAADGDFKKKFERLAEVLGVENPLKNMAEILEKAVDISLEKKDPKRKLERRLERQRKESEPKGKSRPEKRRDKTGKVQRRRNSHIEELTTHDDPELCGHVRKDVPEALAGAHVGWVLSLEKDIVPGAEVVPDSEGNTWRTVREGEVCRDLAWSKTPSMRGSTLRENREAL
jgi:hypothetical protein